MKKLLILLILLTPFQAFSQLGDVIFPFYNNGKWGFMNKHKKIIVCPKYEEAYPSLSKRLRVKVNGKYGYIDHSG